MTQPAWHQLVLDHMDDARKHAHSIYRTKGYVHTFPHILSDFIAAAQLGLVQAAKRFDPEKGVKFHTYAMPFIRGAI